jgi:16S rRNA (cytosine1402-N4)-methyltransferase
MEGKLTVAETPPHIPVMLNEVLEILAPQDSKVYIDATFGAGGYSQAILAAANCKLYAIDRDPTALHYVKQLQDKVGPNRLEFIQGNFGDISELALAHGISKVDGIVFDIGVSSMQLDTENRGFSFNLSSRLDMRMSSTGLDAYEVINTTPEEELANIIYLYGDERKSRKIAYRIVRAREKAPIVTTVELANIVRSACGYKPYQKIDPSTKTFQAIRIWVNDELNELRRGLIAAKELLAPGGKLIVVSFHSLEDSIIKSFFNDESGKIVGGSRYLPEIVTDKKFFSFKILTPKALKPTEEEVASNPRSRSAKLRAGLKLENMGENA